MEAARTCPKPAISGIQIQDPASREVLAGRKGGIRSGREVLAGRKGGIRSGGEVLAGRKEAIRRGELMLVEARAAFPSGLLLKKRVSEPSSGVRTLKPLGGIAAI